MTDCELLELAAKAAGVEIASFSVSAFGAMVERADGGWWDPLDDDGDALRLCAALCLDLSTHGMGVYARTITGIEPAHGASAPECSDKDRMMLIRRSIVRVAADIGRDMQ